MAQSGELPAFKVRDQWRFRRAGIDEGIDKQAHSEPPDGALDE